MKRFVVVPVLLLIMLSAGLLVACGGGGGGGGGNAVYSYTSTDTPIPIPDEDSIVSSLVVTGAPTSISNVTVTLQVLHTYVADLLITIESPEGTPVVLSNHGGSSGENIWNTVFDDNTAAFFASTDEYDAPYTGSYQPYGALADVNGENANGAWLLSIDDTSAGDFGYLFEWSIDIE